MVKFSYECSLSALLDVTGDFAISQVRSVASVNRKKRKTIDAGIIYGRPSSL